MPDDKKKVDWGKLGALGSAVEGFSYGTLPRALLSYEALNSDWSQGDSAPEPGRLEEIKSQVARTVDEHPYWNFAGGMAAPSPFGKAKTGQKLGAALLSSMGRGAAAGGLAGGVRGLTSTPEDSSAMDYMKNAATGALKGGAAGAVISPALTGIGKSLGWVARKMGLHSIAPTGLHPELRTEKGDSTRAMPRGDELAQRALDEGMIPWFGGTRKIQAGFEKGANEAGNEISSTVANEPGRVNVGRVVNQIDNYVPPTLRERVAKGKDLQPHLADVSSRLEPKENSLLQAWNQRVGMDEIGYPDDRKSAALLAEAARLGRGYMEKEIQGNMSPAGLERYLPAKDSYRFMAAGAKQALKGINDIEASGIGGNSPQASIFSSLLRSTPSQVATSFGARLFNPPGKLAQKLSGPMSKATGSMLGNSGAPPERGPSTSDPGYTLIPDDEEAPASKGYTLIPD